MGYKVLMLNGSPHTNGCVATGLEEIAAVLNEEQIETEIIEVGSAEVRGCAGCQGCFRNEGCVFGDLVNETAAKFAEADGLIIASPVYYSGPNGTLLAFLDRLFYSTQAAKKGGFSKQMKVGAAVVNCRRAGNTASFDVLNKYFTISGMPVASSTYWNMTHGFVPADVKKDLEGLQTLRNLARNMAFLIRAIDEEKKRSGLPAQEESAFTSFPDGK